MTPLSPLSRLFAAALSRKTSTAAEDTSERVTMEQVQAPVPTDGTYLIQGVKVPTVTPVVLQPGDNVPVLWRGAEPKWILANQQRRGARRAPAMEIPAGVVEELLIGPIFGADGNPVYEDGVLVRDVWFRNDAQMISLELRTFFPHPPTTVKWGQRSNTFFVKAEDEDDPASRVTYYIFTLNRLIGEPLSRRRAAARLVAVQTVDQPITIGRLVTSEAAIPGEQVLLQVRYTVTYPGVNENGFVLDPYSGATSTAVLTSPITGYFQPRDLTAVVSQTQLDLDVTDEVLTDALHIVVCGVLWGAPFIPGRVLGYLPTYTQADDVSHPVATWGQAPDWSPPPVGWPSEGGRSVGGFQPFLSGGSFRWAIVVDLTSRKVLWTTQPTIPYEISGSVRKLAEYPGVPTFGFSTANSAVHTDFAADITVPVPFERPIFPWAPNYWVPRTFTDQVPKVRYYNGPITEWQDFTRTWTVFSTDTNNLGVIGADYTASGVQQANAAFLGLLPPLISHTTIPRLSLGSLGSPRPLEPDAYLYRTVEATLTRPSYVVLWWGWPTTGVGLPYYETIYDSSFGVWSWIAAGSVRWAVVGDVGLSNLQALHVDPDPSKSRFVVKATRTVLRPWARYGHTVPVSETAYFIADGLGGLVATLVDWRSEDLDKLSRIETDMSFARHHLLAGVDVWTLPTLIAATIRTQTVYLANLRARRVEIVAGPVTPPSPLPMTVLTERGVRVLAPDFVYATNLTWGVDETLPTPPRPIHFFVDLWRAQTGALSARGRDWRNPKYPFEDVSLQAVKRLKRDAGKLRQIRDWMIEQRDTQDVEFSTVRTFHVVPARSVAGRLGSAG